MTTTAGPSSLPGGTVAFLMSDIEGSTQLVGRLGEAWPGRLDEHFALMRAAVAAHGGTWISSEGDSVFAVFPSVREAIAAAIHAQRETGAAEGPDGSRLKARMGIHAGEAVLGGRDYTGIEVHRTARLAAAGHGGQILVSEAARALTPDPPAAGLSYRDLGTHQLRDIPAPERIHQLVGRDLASEFPPLRTQSSSVRTNLPAPLTRFVGRTREVREVSELLQRDRLVTLTGPGGTGKTRLAIETARRLLSAYADGVWFVALDVVREPAAVVPTVAATLAVAEQPGRSMSEVLIERLAATHSLLVLDNFEQVVEAAPDIGALLAAAPNLRVLASSREPLRIVGEAVYPVAPLGVPAEPGKPTADQLQGLEAVDLFVDRARSVRPDFRLTDANAPSVAAICRRLDGLPLALELAAARTNLLSPDQILARLDQRLTLLASSRRDLPDRQRTLRGAIDWSHDLLSEAERVIFRRFSVFSGGADFNSLAGVLDPEGELGIDLLDLASSLVDRSLLRSILDGGDNRVGMLETIREYAAERLATSGEERIVRDRHAAHFRRLAETARYVLTDPRRDEILDQLDRELPNLRAALRWSLEGGDLDAGLAIASDLGDYWDIRGHSGEGRDALGPLLRAAASRPPSALAARATNVAATLAAWHVDFAAAGVLGAEALRLAEELGDPELLIEAYVTSGWANVGPLPAVAREQFSRALELARGLGDDRMLRLPLGGLSVALLNLGELDEAMDVSIEVADLLEEAGDAYNATYARLGIGQIKLRRGDTAGALGELVVALRRFRDAGASMGIAMALDVIALIAIKRGDPARAALLGAFADKLRREAGGGGGSTLISNDEPPLLQARRLMDPVEFDRAVAEGEALDLDQAEQEAIATGESG
ncbi:MAG TPA: adenylate/guanylate cyclase domain-containing protein [Candidatus Eisenbacteria bacterium]|nr:adenylate/guanylate cyclase domain-containing protein [Candidatus Eisenbacteria bacterium]